MRFENYASPNFPRQTVILPEFSPNSDVNFTLLAALIGHPAFGKPEVSLEPYRGWYAIFQVPKNFTCVFTQFHAIFTLFGLFQPFLAQFQHVAYQKACTRAEKSISDTFTQFNARLNAISRNFMRISRNFHAIWTISAIFWANFNMLVIKKYVLELRNS